MTDTVDISIYKTKTNSDKTFDLANPGQRQIYFEQKIGNEIEQIKVYLENHTFVAFLMGKKNAGKGTYAGLLKEIFGENRIDQISVGDLTRAVFDEIQTESGMKSLRDYLEKNYRGYMSINEAIETFQNKTQGKLLPTEFILTLVTREIEKMPKKALLIDGFPRNTDQVSYSLYMRQIINFRNDPDFFIFIDVPEAVIDARIKARVICPECQTSRSLTLLPTSKIGFDESTQSYYLICDNPNCKETRMIPKEGDELGIEPIKDRIKLDGELMEMAKQLHGIQKIYAKNSFPADQAKNLCDDYEITPEFYYEKDSTGKIITKTKPWTFVDDEGNQAISLMAPTVMIGIIRQLAKILPKTK